MRVASLVLSILVLAYVTTAQAESLSTSYNGVPDEVIEHLGKKDVRGMFKAMAKGTQAEQSPREIEPGMEAFVKLFEAQFDNTGDFLDAALYKEEHFGTRYSILTYVLNYAEKPMAAKLKMYNGERGWRMTNIVLQPEIDKFVDEERGVQAKGKS